MMRVLIVDDEPAIRRLLQTWVEEEGVAALDADSAEEMLGESVAVIVDAGASPGGVASTIIDATGDRPRLLRDGAIAIADSDAALADLDLTVDTGLPEPTEAESTDA
jgi:CheY-like chemotaxis protein